MGKVELLTTTAESNRSLSLRLAIEKNRISSIHRVEAGVLKLMAGKVGSARQLLNAKSIQNGLLVASGLSSQSINRLDKSGKTQAIARLIDDVLEPSGENFADTLEQLYLRTKRRALRRKPRNLADAIAYQRLFRKLISVLNLAGVKYRWKDTAAGWLNSIENNTGIEKRISVICWEMNGRKRLLATRTNLPLIGKNVALSLFDATTDDYDGDKRSLFKQYTRYVALGELNGCIDSTRANEHWKKSGLSLSGIRSSFQQFGLNPPTFFIGAAIERSMAVEIVGQLEKGILNRAANLTKDDQLALVCEWIVNL